MFFMAVKRYAKQQRDIQLRLATFNESEPGQIISKGYLRVDAYLTAGPGHGRYFGLNFPVSVKSNQHLEFDQEAAFFRGSEEILAFNSRAQNTSLVNYDPAKHLDNGPIDKDNLFPIGDDFSGFPHCGFYDCESDESPVLRIPRANLNRLWTRDRIAELVGVIKDDVGELAYKVQPIRFSDGQDEFRQALGGFSSDFQVKAFEAGYFNFEMEGFRKKLKVVAGRTPYARFVSVPIGGQPK